MFIHVHYALVDDKISRHSSIPVVCLCYCNSADYEHSDIHNELYRLHELLLTGATRHNNYPALITWPARPAEPFNAHVHGAI